MASSDDEKFWRDFNRSMITMTNYVADVIRMRHIENNMAELEHQRQTQFLVVDRINKAICNDFGELIFLIALSSFIAYLIWKAGR